MTDTRDRQSRKLERRNFLNFPEVSPRSGARSLNSLSFARITALIYEGTAVEKNQGREIFVPYVSTGHLPSPEHVKALVADAYKRFRSNTEGQTSKIYPALANVTETLFGVCVVGTSGNVYAAGDSDHEFPIMSVSKPYIFALVCQTVGAQEARERIGVNATGLPFNSLKAIEGCAAGETNPIVNSGAIATTSLVPGSSSKAKWQFIETNLSRFAGRALSFNEDVFANASRTNFRNREIAERINTIGQLSLGPADAADLYTRQRSLNFSARDLVIMGATLADG